MMLIDCDTCAARTLACGDCVVAFMLGDRSDPIELDSAEESALGAFARGGLLPPLRLVPAYRAQDTSGMPRQHAGSPEEMTRGREKPDAGKSAIA
ncbi:MAG TPA: hypothetical protein VHO01_03675 [Jatrophihabitans sp.]|nr:hypothetical protein [Jatrophihabitans sp.]